jgi:hypothetical protein
MMNVAIPAALSSAESDVALDATYFLVRMLRNVLRGFHEVEVSPETPLEARETVAAAADEIEQREGTSLSELPRERVAAYLEVLNQASSAFHASAVGGTDSARGQEILAGVEELLDTSNGHGR